MIFFTHSQVLESGSSGDPFFRLVAIAVEKKVVIGIYVYMSGWRKDGFVFEG